MSRYSKFKERQRNASPYAAQAVCSRCRHCERVRGAAFCNGFDKRRRVYNSAFYSTKEGYCTQYYPEKKERSE